MSNRVCSSCGKTFESFGLSSGPAICNECFTEKNPDIPEQEDVSNFDYEMDSNDEADYEMDSNDEAESSVSLNQNVADLFISVNTFLYILGFVLIAIFGLSFGSNGILIVLFCSLILFVSWGAFAIIAEIYKNLKEINAKIKSPDKD